ncbi:MAG: HU-CCDC81 and SPOR domain-containing protein [Flavobacterium sp.]|nr:HU-CCDC81 and SPOR domain-containing protein [Flavobacterium sp.]
MKIEQYISQLLYRYQCVTISGFGAFLTEIQSAQLVENTHSFYPPKKLISFNINLKNNDGLLANHIAQSEKIPYEVAVKAIENQVFNWKNKLEDFGAIMLKNIGEIALNNDNNLVFQPYNNFNYLTNSFGLSSYVSPAIKREILVHLDEKNNEENVIINLSERKNKYSYLKYVAIFTISLGVFGALGYKFYENKVNAETLIVQTNVQQQVNKKIQEATFFITTPVPSVTLTVKNEKLPYHVVAGAFREEKNAAKIFVELLKLGYPARRIQKNKSGLYPVLYQSFSNYSEAQKAMISIQKSHNPEAWLLIEEL